MRIPQRETPNLAYNMPRANRASPKLIYPVISPHLDPDPNQADDNIHPLAVPAVVLITPHAVPLLVPVGPGGGVHAPPADVRLAVRRDWGALRLNGDALGVGRRRGALGLVEVRGGNEMLDYGGVDGELVGGVRVFRGGF